MTRHAHNFKDLSGQRFGRLLVLRYAPEWERGYWRVRCDCGTEYFQDGDSLRRGSAKSCGCLRAELAAALGKRIPHPGKANRPMEAVRPDGNADYTARSSQEMASFFGVTRSTINAHVRSGEPLKGYTIKTCQI